jgi:hypothetical protein
MDDLYNRWLKDKLTDTETAYLLKKIESDPKFRQHEQVLNAYRRSFENPQKMQAAKKLDQLYLDFCKKERNNFYFKVAAILLLIIGIGSVYFFSSLNSSTEDKLYTLYFKPFDPPDRYRKLTNSENVLDSAFTDYNEGNFKHAAQKFAVYLISDSTNTAIIFYSGICSMENSDYYNASKNFVQIILSNDLIFYYPSIWYNSLCLLKQNNIPETIRNLEMLIQKENPYKQDAEELLNKLKLY